MLTPTRVTVAILFLLLLLTGVGLAQNDDDEQEIFSSLRHIHRINAHGDEFMSMEMSPDKKRLAIGTEKGDLIIWNDENDLIRDIV